MNTEIACLLLKTGIAHSDIGEIKVKDYKQSNKTVEVKLQQQEK